MLRHAATVTALLVMGCAAATSDDSIADSARPKAVLVVVVDTLRADHVGAYGYSRATTPFVDSVAAGGLRFESVWAPAPWTVPSVASMWTGLAPGAHGAGLTGRVRSLGTEVPRLLDPGLATLPAVLGQANWHTVLVSGNPYLHGPFREIFANSHVERASAGSLVDLTLREVRKQPSDRPVFAWVQLMDVHQPNLPPQPYFNFFEAGSGPREEKHGDWSHGQQEDMRDPSFVEFRAHRIAAYDGALRYVDDQIRILLEGFEEHFGAGEVLVVVTSDHGEEFWDHAEDQVGRDDDVRGIWGVGHGHTVFEEQLRVPLIVEGPGISKRVVSCPVSLLALPRSILSRAGVDVPPAMSGPSLFSTEQPQRCDRWVRWAEGTAFGLDTWALEVSGLKLIATADDRVRLYDLGADPLERQDLAAERPDDAARLHLAGERLRQRSERRPGEGGPTLVLDDELRRELAALGYL